MDKIHVHKTKKSICAHFAESPCISGIGYCYKIVSKFIAANLFVGDNNKLFFL